jgi:SNF2 family DNA or RNA helicase
MSSGTSLNQAFSFRFEEDLILTAFLSPCSIVFSTWRLTLNIVEAGLNQASIRCLRFDGKVPQSERQSVIEEFRKDASVRVLLLTLACGNAG